MGLWGGALHPLPGEGLGFFAVVGGVLGAVGEEFVGDGVRDGDLGKLADGEGGGDVDGAVDVWGVPGAAGDAGGVHKHAQRAADGGLADFVGDAAEDHGEFVGAAFAGGVVDLVGHFGGEGAFFFGVGEDAGAFEAVVADEVAEFGVVVFRLAGEAADEGGAEAEAGDGGAHVVDEAADVGAVGHAALLGEDVVGDVLEGDVDVFDDFVAGGEGVDEFSAPVGGVGVEDADPEVAGDGVEFAQEAGEGFAAGGVDTAGFGGAVGPFVHAVVGGVLGDEVEFFHSGGDEGAGFAEDVGLGAAAVAAADAGDGAVGAGVVAAFGDFEVGGVRGGEEVAGVAVVGEVGGDGGGVGFFGAAGEEVFGDGGDAADEVDADEAVDFREAGDEVAGVALGEAAGDEEFLVGGDGALLPGAAGGDDGVDGFLLGGVDEGAGVDDEEVGLLGGGAGVAGGEEVAKHDFGVDEVFGAAEGDDCDVGHAGVGTGVAWCGRRGLCGGAPVGGAGALGWWGDGG